MQISTNGLRLSLPKNGVTVKKSTSAVAAASTASNSELPEKYYNTNGNGVGKEAFMRTELTSLRLTKVKQIPVGLCNGSTELRDVQLGRSLEEIDAVAFENCVNLTSINIPESVDSIGRRAFANCTSLTTITIPKRVSFLAMNAFEGCSNLVVQTYTADWDKRLRACGVKDIVHLQ